MSRLREQILADVDALGYPRAGKVGYAPATAEAGDAIDDWKRPLDGHAAVRENIAARKAWRATASPADLQRLEELLNEEKDLLDELTDNSDGRRLDATIDRELRRAGAGPRTLEFAKRPQPFPAWCAARDWWEAVPRPTWLVLVGPRGRGKSVGATWAVLRAIEANKSARILHASALDALSSFGDGRREFDELCRTWLLVLMDFQTAPSDRAKTQLFRLLDVRHEHKRPTIITSNLDRADLARRLEGPLASRIRSDGVIVELPHDGDDLRQTALFQKASGS